jgi:hypothetical protein
MIRHTSFVSLALAALTTLGLSGSAAAGEQVTFSGTLEGSEGQRSIDFPYLSTTTTGSGIATELGKYTFTMPHLVNLNTRAGVGSFEFVAANGDTLVGTMTGQATPISDTVVSIVEEVIITGGTGRFDGATGAFEIQRIYDQVANWTTGTFEGTISSPGSGH